MTAGFVTLADALERRNALESAPYRVAFHDYGAVQRESRAIASRLVAAERERDTIFSESSAQREELEELKSISGRSKEAEELSIALEKAQGELSLAYKQSAKVAQDMLQSKSREEDLRVSLAKKTANASELSSQLSSAVAENERLLKQLDSEREAREIAAMELETKKKAFDDNERLVESLQRENKELIRRVMQMKDEQADKLNEINEMYSDLMKSAETAAAVAQEVNSSRVGAPINLQAPASPRGTESGALPVESLPKHLMRRYTGHEGGCYALVCGPPNSLFSGGVDTTVRFCPTAGISNSSDCSLLQGSTGTIMDLDVTLDGKTVIGGGTDKCVRVWDVKSGRMKHALHGHNDAVLSAKFLSSNPLRAASGGKDRVLKIWELHRGVCTQSMPCYSIINTVAVSSDASAVYTGHLDGKLRQWDHRTSTQVMAVSDLHPGGITSITLGSDGTTILTCGRDNSLRVLDTRAFEVQRTLKAPSFRVVGNTVRASLSPEATHAACGTALNVVNIWNILTGELVAVLQGHNAAIMGCAWSANNLVSCDRGGDVIVWR